MLGAGIAIGAAIGPAPEPSLAGTSAVVQSLPGLIASLSAHSAAATPSSPQPAASAPTVRRRRRRRARVAAPSPTTAANVPAQSTPPGSGEAPTAPAASKPRASKLPPITSVWVIELAGTSFAEAQATPSAAPYITGQLIPKGTLLSGWSALEGSAFANDAPLAEHRPTVGGTPPVLHSIMQPACPEGVAGAACATGPGQLTAADEFVKTAIATITATTTYAEHGLVVVTFASVAGAAAAELPAGSSSATLATQPPAGVVLLSPFAKARRDLKRDLQPDFTQTGARRAPALKTPTINDKRTESTVARITHRPPKAHALAGRDHGRGCPLARESGSGHGRRIESQQLQLPR